MNAEESISAAKIVDERRPEAPRGSSARSRNGTRAAPRAPCRILVEPVKRRRPRARPIYDRAMPRTLLLVENASVPTRSDGSGPSRRRCGTPGGTSSSSARQGRRARRAREDLDGIEIHRFRPPRRARAARRLRRPSTRAPRRGCTRDRQASWHANARFDIVHAANPPDVLLLTALPAATAGRRRSSITTT